MIQELSNRINQIQQEIVELQNTKLYAGNMQYDQSVLIEIDAKKVQVLELYNKQVDMLPKFGKDPYKISL
jgi:hypothetical protein